MLLLKLFFSFIQVGLFSVGGGYAAIPLIQEQIVNIHHLMTMEEFSDLITVAEMTPGPISINSSTFVGMRIAGIGGVLLCSLGCIIPSFVICFILASILMLALFQTDIFSASLKDIRFVELGIFLVALFLLRKFKTNAITIILGSGVVGTLIYMLLGMV